MWSSEHSAETAASADRLFDLFKNVAAWPEWNDGVQSIQLDGSFTAGTTGTMVVPGQDPLAFRLVWVEENRGFEDETEIPDAGVTVRVHHSLEPLTHGGTRITYRCVIDGPAADQIGPSIGPEISGDFPEVIAALVVRAEG